MRPVTARAGRTAIGLVKIEVGARRGDGGERAGVRQWSGAIRAGGGIGGHSARDRSVDGCCG